jgi:flagellum-specific peptidoglycan hydrolase FlgJ
MQQFEQDFIASIKPAAKACQANYGVPAAITMAQCILESSWGRSMPPGSNNPFGIKASHLNDPSSYVEAATTEFEGGVLEHVQQPFQRYSDLSGAFAAHGALLADNPRYAAAMAMRSDLKRFATVLMACGYSTNRPGLAPGPTYYDDSLMQLITEFNLAG